MPVAVSAPALGTDRVLFDHMETAVVEGAHFAERIVGAGAAVDA